MQNKGSSVIGGFVWKLLERFLAQLITFVVSIVLARMLSPEDYGVISIVLIFIIFADVFVTNGFGTALIQKKDATDLDFSTLFYCSFTISIIIYGVLFIMAPIIASFYKNPILVPVIRIFSLRIPISSYNSIQHAYVSRHMLFKKFFFSTLGGTLLSAFVGIGLAYRGMGVWAIVAQYLVNTVVDTIVLGFTIPWKLKFQFSKSAAKQLMGYGWKVACAALSGTFFTQLRSLIIGKFYSAADLAYYERGRSFASLATDNVSNAIMSVMFPSFANINENKIQVKKKLQQTIRIMSYVIFPIIIGIALVAKDVVRILLTDKWMSSVPYMQILSISAAVAMIGDVSLQAINAIGKSEATLKLELIKKPMYLLLLLVGIRISVLAVAVTMLMYSIYATLANVSTLNKYLEYSLLELLKDIGPAVCLCFFMSGIVLGVQLLHLGSMLGLILEILVGIVGYIFMSIITKNSSYIYIYVYIKNVLSPNK